MKRIALPPVVNSRISLVPSVIATRPPWNRCSAQHGGVGRRPAAPAQPEGNASTHLRHRREVVTRRTVYELRKARERAISGRAGDCVANIDEIIAAIKASPSPAEAKVALMSRPWGAARFRDAGRAGASRPGRRSELGSFGIVAGGYRLTDIRHRRSGDAP